MASIASRRIIVLLISILSLHITNAQFRKITVQDAQTKDPLAFASIVLQQEKKILFTDSVGVVYIDETVFSKKDTLKISFINYANVTIPSAYFFNNIIS